MPFFGALDGQQLLAIEGSCTISLSDQWTYTCCSFSACVRNNHNHTTTTTTTTGVHARECHLCPWTPLSSPVQELHSEESSDDCARGGDTSSSRPLRPWPRRYTTPPKGDRRRPGPGSGGANSTTRRRPGGPPLPSRSLESGGGRPGSVTDPAPQLRVQRHTVEHRVEACTFVKVLDAPVPQGGNQLVAAWWHLDLIIPEQVIEVPKVSSSSRRSRRRRFPSARRRRNSWWKCWNS